MAAQQHAIPIVIENNGKLELNREGVRTVFTDPKLNGKKICIISIAGSFRKGKSFMLNFFLRYLRRQGYRNTMWMGHDDSPVNDNGFSWKGGRNPVTAGIVIHREIFISEKNGEEVVILLMDTQGLFDGQMDNAKNCVVFALSTLLSSVLIYNLSQQIHDSDLEYLEYFTEYARVAKEASSSHKPFQTLTFLIRDWPHAVELDFGMKGGAKYLDEVLQKQSTTQGSVRSHLQNTFEATNCCLLPYPGKKTAETDHVRDLRLSDIEQKFRAHTKEFVHQILKPENLVVKHINGQPLHANAIMQFLEDSMESLNSGKLPSVNRMMQTVAAVQNLEAQQRSVTKYREGFSEMFTGDNFYDDVALQEMHCDLHAASMKFYSDLTRFGGEESRAKYRHHLLTSLEREFRQVTRINQVIKSVSESKVLQLIERLTEGYELQFKNQHRTNEGKNYWGDKDLESLHTAISSVVFDNYKSDQLYRRFPEKLSQLQERVKMSFQKFKRDNEEAMRVDKEKDSKKKTLLRKQMELILDFRGKIAQSTSEYIEEHKLKELCDFERTNAVHMHDVVLFEQQLDTNDADIQYAQFIGRIQDEIERFTRINEEKKNRFKKYLDYQSHSVQLQYEKTISSILTNGYMEEKELRKLHDEIVSYLTTEHENQYNKHQRSQQLVQDHLKKIPDDLESKYADTRKLNEENYSIFGRIFKILKKGVKIIEVVGKVIAAIPTIAALFFL